MTSIFSCFSEFFLSVSQCYLCHEEIFSLSDTFLWWSEKRLLESEMLSLLYFLWQRYSSDKRVYHTQLLTNGPNWYSFGNVSHDDFIHQSCKETFLEVSLTQLDRAPIFTTSYTLPNVVMKSNAERDGDILYRLTAAPLSLYSFMVLYWGRYFPE